MTRAITKLSDFLSEAKAASEKGYVGVHCGPRSLGADDFHSPTTRPSSRS